MLRSDMDIQMDIVAELKWPSCQSDSVGKEKQAERFDLPGNR